MWAICFVMSRHSTAPGDSLPWGKKRGVSPGKATSWFKVEKRSFWAIGLKNTLRAGQLLIYSPALVITGNPVSLGRHWICVSCLFIGAPWSFLPASTTGSLDMARGTVWFGRGMRVLGFVVLVASVIAETKYLAKTA